MQSYFLSEVGHYVPGLHFKDEFNTENAGEGNEIIIGKPDIFMEKEL